MERHFHCTACGKCCHGWLPLTIPDALANAERFPLFLLWSTARPGGKSYEVTARLGVTLRLKTRKEVAVRVTPFSYVPSASPCPALLADGRCAVHDAKPLRCRAMPFSASRAEDDQTDLLIPKPGWACDVSTAAPLVYRDKTIVARADFEAERHALHQDAQVLKPFAQLMLDGAPPLRLEVEKMALRPGGGGVIVNFSKLVPRLAEVDIFALAAAQLPVMEAFAERTAGDAAQAEAHKRYAACAREWRAVLDGA